MALNSFIIFSFFLQSRWFGRRTISKGWDMLPNCRMFQTYFKKLYGNNIILYVLDGVTYHRLWFPCTFFKFRSDFDNRNEIEKVTWFRMLLNLKSAMYCEVSIIWSWNTVDLSESLEPWLVAILQMKPTRAIYRFVSVPGTTVKPIRDIRWPASSAYISKLSLSPIR